MAFTIRLFGSIHVERAGQEVPLRPASQMLLLYLLLHRHKFHRRELLAAVFWGDSDDRQARRCLNSALWRLRGELNAVADNLSTNPRGDIRFALGDDNRLDVEEFEIITRSNLSRPPQGLALAELAGLEHAVALYQGDLAENCYYDWAVPERERLRALYLDALFLLLKAYIHHRDYQTAIPTAQQLLHVDPLREDVHRVLMRVYGAVDQRGRALQQYLLCRRLLHDELNVEPVPETTALYERLQNGALIDPQDGPAAPDEVIWPSGARPAARQTAVVADRLQQLMYHVQFELQDTLRTLQQLAGGEE